MTNSETSLAKERVKIFFSTEVSGYILKDIEKLDAIRPGGDGLGGCTIPLALMLFAVIDYFGYLTRDDAANPSKEDTLGNFKYLFSRGAGFFPEIYEAHCDTIVKLFRHGLVHQFFPKASGITKEENRPLIFNDDDKPVLNVDVLSRDVKEALHRIQQSIIQNHNNTLADRINSRLDKLIKEDYGTLSNL